MRFFIKNTRMYRPTVTIQCNIVIPYFGRIRILIASLSNVKCSVMLWSDNRNIMDYWMLAARYCFKYDF